MWTHSSGGSLDLRLRGSVLGTSAEILSVLREVDLLPLWNRYCDGASVRELVSPTELYAAAGVRLPWPVLPVMRARWNPRPWAVPLPRSQAAPMLPPRAMSK